MSYLKNKPWPNILGNKIGDTKRNPATAKDLVVVNDKHVAIEFKERVVVELPLQTNCTKSGGYERCQSKLLEPTLQRVVRKLCIDCKSHKVMTTNYVSLAFMNVTGYLSY